MEFKLRMLKGIMSGSTKYRLCKKYSVDYVTPVAGKVNFTESKTLYFTVRSDRLGIRYIWHERNPNHSNGQFSAGEEAPEEACAYAIGLPELRNEALPGFLRSVGNNGIDLLKKLAPSGRQPSAPGIPRNRSVA